MRRLGTKKPVDVPAPVDPASLDPDTVAIDQGRAEAEPKVAPTTRKPRAKKAPAAQAGGCGDVSPNDPAARCGRDVGHEGPHMVIGLQARLDADLVHDRAMLDQAGLNDSLSVLSSRETVAHGLRGPAGSTPTTAAVADPGEPSRPALAAPAGTSIPSASPAPAVPRSARRNVASRSAPGSVSTQPAGGARPEGGDPYSRRAVKVPDAPPADEPIPGGATVAPLALNEGDRGSSPRPGTSAAAAASPPAGVGPGAAAVAEGMAGEVPAAAVSPTAPITRVLTTERDFRDEIMDALEQAEAELAFDASLARVPYVPDTPEKARWLARLFLEFQERFARLEAAYKEAKRRYQNQIRHVSQRFEVPLADEVMREVADEQRRYRKAPKKIAFEEGHFKFLPRKTAPRMPSRKDAKQTLARWAELREPDQAACMGPDGGRFGRYVYQPSPEKLAGHFEDTGELPPGMTTLPDGDDLYIVSSLKTERGHQFHKGLNVSKLAREAASKALPGGHDEDDQDEESEE